MFTLCCKVWQMHNVTCLPLQYHTKYFYCARISYASLIYPFPLPSELLATADYFILSIGLLFPEYHIIGFIEYVTFVCMQSAKKYMSIICKPLQSELSTLSPGFQSSQIMGSIFLLSPYLARILIWLTFFKVNFLSKGQENWWDIYWLYLP